MTNEPNKPYRAASNLRFETPVRRMTREFEEFVRNRMTPEDLDNAIDAIGAEYVEIWDEDEWTFPDEEE